MTSVQLAAAAVLSTAAAAGGLAYAALWPQSQLFGRVLVAGSNPGEIALTYDDGPNDDATERLLEVLARHEVHATFFLIGKSAAEHPDLVKRIAAEGHTIGHHTWSHPSLLRIPPQRAIAEIDRGIAADEMALHGVSTTKPSTPFFRFPGFESTPATLELLQSRGIVVFGADLWASDWNEMTPEQELKLLTERLNAAGKGIILLHDPKARTAAMLPAFLRYLREKFGV